MVLLRSSSLLLPTDRFRLLHCALLSKRKVSSSSPIRMASNHDASSAPSQVHPPSGSFLFHNSCFLMQQSCVQEKQNKQNTPSPANVLDIYWKFPSPSLVSKFKPELVSSNFWNSSDFMEISDQTYYYIEVSWWFFESLGVLLQKYPTNQEYFGGFLLCKCGIYMCTLKICRHCRI